MIKTVPKKLDFLIRLCLLGGVLAGLLFSCSEGIRLFPFPAAEITKSDSSRLDFENKIPYQFNVHRLEDKQGNFKTKSQRGTPHPYSAEGGRLNDPAARPAGTRKSLSFSLERENLKLPVFSRSGESRAPPHCA